MGLIMLAYACVHLVQLPAQVNLELELNKLNLGPNPAKPPVLRPKTQYKFGVLDAGPDPPSSCRASHCVLGPYQHHAVPE